MSQAAPKVGRGGVGAPCLPGRRQGSGSCFAGDRAPAATGRSQVASPRSIPQWAGTQWPPGRDREWGPGPPGGVRDSCSRWAEPGARAPGLPSGRRDPGGSRAKPGGWTRVPSIGRASVIAETRLGSKPRGFRRGMGHWRPLAQPGDGALDPTGKRWALAASGMIRCARPLALLAGVGPRRPPTQAKGVGPWAPPAAAGPSRGAWRRSHLAGSRSLTPQD